MGCEHQLRLDEGGLGFYLAVILDLHFSARHQVGRVSIGHERRNLAIWALTMAIAFPSAT